MVTKNPDIDFLDFSRKIKLYSDSVEIKLPRNRADRDKKLLESLKFIKEYTLLSSQICQSMHFLKDRIESTEGYQNLPTLEEFKEYMKTLTELKEIIQSQISIRSEAK